MASLFFRVPLQQIGFLRAILEGYDGLALLHAPDPRRGEVEWIIGENLEEEASALAARLVREIGMVEIDRPSDWPESQSADAAPRRGKSGGPSV